MTPLIVCHACQHMSFTEVGVYQLGIEKSTGGWSRRSFRELFLLRFGKVDNDKHVTRLSFRLVTVGSVH
jgi:hypothetical protein